MNKWNPQRAKEIRRFIDEYFIENHKSPSVREIAASTGIATVFFRFRNGMKISPNTVRIFMTSLPVTSSRKQFLWKTTTSSEL